MSNTITELKVGTRASKLALKQTKQVLDKLKAIEGIKKKFLFKIVRIKTEGDINKSKILDAGYKGFFTKRIDEMLLKKKIDLAIHSAKDIPSHINNNIVIGGFLKREDPRDILFSKKNFTFNKLPKSITVGTSSIRRKKQIQALRPDLNIKYMRGNIETRIKKFKNNNYFAIILALAGIKRLGIKYKKKNILDITNFIPAGGQGAIAVTIRKKSSIINELVTKINDNKTETEVKTERTFLKNINADCNSPVGAHARLVKKTINFSVTVPNKDSLCMFIYKTNGRYDKAEILGLRAANFLKKQLGNNFLKNTNILYKPYFLLTRSIEQSNKLIKNLNLKNINFIKSPLLKIKPINLNKSQISEIKSADTLIFTSANAVNFTKKYIRSFPKKIFCVGDDTKMACLKNNMKNISASNGNINNLIRLIIKKNKDKRKKIIYISGKQTSVKLTLILKSKKFNIKKVVAYESQKITSWDKSILNKIKFNQISYISFFSKRTAEAFNQLVNKYKLRRYLFNVVCISFSSEIENLLKKNNFRNYYLPSKPNGESFVKLLNSLNSKDQG